MIPVLDRAGMREADRVTIAELGLPGMVLMEGAAGAVTEVVVDRFAERGRVAVLCGPGNNGGDGLAVARQLRCRGVDAEAALLVAPGALMGDAAAQLALARAYGVPLHECAGDLGALGIVLASADVIVDALFGTGLDRPLVAPWSDVVRAINERGVPVVAVDLPSGLSGDSAAIFGEAVEAAVTVTFAAPKLAHVLPPACWRCGDVAVGDIGIPPWVLEAHSSVGMLEAADVAGWLPLRPVDAHKGRFGHLVVIAGRVGRAGAAAPKLAHVLPPACWRCGDVAVGDIGIPPWVLEAHSSVGMLEAADVAGWLPLRPVDAHKGRFGHLVVIAGRVGRAGAAALAARASVLAGAGLVTVATAPGAVAAVQATVPEAMVDPLPADGDGVVTGAGLDGLLAKATAIAIGPGLGLGDGPARLLADLLARWRGPLLVDADALTLLAGRPQALAGREAPTVATPHPGELARLLGTGTDAVTADRLAAARSAARAAGATVLAKGARTIVAEPDGRAVVNPTGCPGLATGGSGDVLTGVVGALLAQGLPGLEAAAAGAYLHGRAAELAAERFPGAIPAGELAAALAEAERELRQPPERA